MVTETAMTTKEAIRALDGMAPFLPPGHVEKLRPVLLRTAEAEGQYESIRKAIVEIEERLQQRAAQEQAIDERLRGKLAHEQQVDARTRELEERARQADSAWNSRRALIGEFDKLREAVEAAIARIR